MKKILTTAVIVTVKNDSNGLQWLLSDLFVQTLPANEIIIVLAGRDRKSDEVLTSFSQKLPITCVHMDSATTRSQGRNKGVKLSQSEIIVFTDAGCRPQKEWLSELISPFSNTDTQLVSGYTHAQVHSAWDEAQAPFVLVKRNDIEKHPLPATRNMAIRKNAFEQTGGFRDELNFAEDYEFSRRLRTHGIQAVFAPEAVVLWKPRERLLEFFMMISLLTAGDIQAGNIRLGLISMWVRYGAFLLGFLLILSLSSLQNAVFLLALIYTAYLLSKLVKNNELSFMAKGYFLLFQPVCDMAVLYGTLLGLVWKLPTRENRVR